MRPRQNITALHCLFRYYPADFIEVALLPLLPLVNGVVDEHTDIKQLFYAELNEIIQSDLAAYQQTNVSHTEISENEGFADAQAVINILTTIIPIGYVFFKQGKLNGGSLTIVLDQYDYKPIDEIQAAVHFSLMNYRKITFELYAYGTMANLISSGHFYYATLCAKKNCIYQNRVNFDLPLPNRVLFAAKRLNAVNLFNQNRDKGISFLEGAKRYLEQNENKMVVFMLQQACEFAYRSLIVAFKGKSIKSHELVMLRKHLLHDEPKIVGLFHPKPKKELQLLTILQEAYVKARYDHAYEIEHTLTLGLMEGTSNLMKGVEALFEEYLITTLCDTT